ncbi:MFS transporter [Acidisoma silvae]|uniref:MFS transporter n=1 Tax=Acidisoma silvae TaxID=2802396 RepID=A0A964E0Z2_9PROT|nr:MFS transporter [Acidisoma silvae]MCB8878040.1 MFS transporter [Acidisoma silvae]
MSEHNDAAVGQSGVVLDRAVRKATWRLLPVLLAMYILNYLDRANIAFAKQAFQSSTGVTNIAFALGASIFFIGYALFEFPSNLMLYRFGARRWMARIMVTWGLVASCMLFVHTDRGFTIVRFLLGAAEAGFFPGAILFMTTWFPAKFRGKVFGLFYIGAPLAMIFGAPASGAILDMHGVLGLLNWQLLFLIEGVATILLGIFIFFYLTDKPSEAQWLSSEERITLSDALQQERIAKEQAGQMSLGSAIRDFQLLRFCAIYFLIQVAGYGLVYYMPSQISALLKMKIGLTVGFVTAIPWACAAFAALVFPRLAIKLNLSRGFGIFALIAIAAGLIASGNLPPTWAVIALCFAEMGAISGQAIFWTFPSGYYSGLAAAGSLAIINSVGNLGGFVAPNLKVWADIGFGANGGLYALASAPLIAAIVLFDLAAKRQGSRPAEK